MRQRSAPTATCCGRWPRRLVSSSARLASTTTTTTRRSRSVTRRRAAVVSFTFGCPPEATIEHCQRSGARVWVTVTDVDEATTAAGRGADALVAQGAEAGGHRGSFVDDDDEPATLLDLLADILGALPTASIVATGGLMTGGDAACAPPAQRPPNSVRRSFAARRQPRAMFTGAPCSPRRTLCSRVRSPGGWHGASPTPGPRAWTTGAFRLSRVTPRHRGPARPRPRRCYSQPCQPRPGLATCAAAATYPPATSSPRSPLNCAPPVDCRRRAPEPV